MTGNENTCMLQGASENRLSDKLGGRLGKNPEVQTDFLPDKDREKFEESTRKQIELEYEIRQQVQTPPLPSPNNLNFTRSKAERNC